MRSLIKAISPLEENKTHFFLSIILIKIQYLQTTGIEPDSQMQFLFFNIFVGVHSCSMNGMWTIK